RPSLPPAISTRTRTLSLPAAAARAVWVTKPGRRGLSATSEEPCRVYRRKSRRLNMGSPSMNSGERGCEPPGGLSQLILRHQQDRVDGFAQAVVPVLVPGLTHSQRVHQLLPGD